MKGHFYWPYQASALQHGRPARVASPGTGSLLSSTGELAGPRLPSMHWACPQAACSSTKAAMQMESWQEVNHAVLTSVLGCCTFRGTKTQPLSPSSVNEIFSHSEQLGYESSNVPFTRQSTADGNYKDKTTFSEEKRLWGNLKANHFKTLRNFLGK